MTGRQHKRAVRLTVAGVAVGMGAWLLPAPAFAQPAAPTVPPGEPLPPGQPVVIADDGPAPPPAPPPAGPPPVPQLQNQAYGSGDGPLGFLRDAWNQVKNPFGTPDGMPPMAPGAPPGAGPAPPLPPGYTSITAPESSTPASQPGTEGGGPPLPEGYYPISGPEPPGWYDNPPPPPMPAAGPLG
ncbi:hypothetical protein [Mycolicibacterium phlei]|uniref:hypothetical protein n=1 Tax=Mycolicibacterium phlei TaxID=1771 RepID=UPI0037CA2279